jgi:hypothetical protein
MGSEGKKASAVKIEPNLLMEEPPVVTFDIRAAADPVLPHVELFDCTYRARGKTAKFRIQLRQDHPASGAIPIAAAEGKFLAVAGSDNLVLLEDLMKALEAKRFPAHPKRVAELAFDAVVTGEKQSRTSGGAFSGAPSGDWKLVKVFLPKGGDEGEVYLNMNPVLGKAEFTIKDTDYGDYLLEQLARVL